jgi:hypothetical protein
MLAIVEHSVAFGADGFQILDGVHGVGLFYVGERNVMGMRVERAGYQ